MSINSKIKDEISRVLIVDDEQAIRDALEELLTTCGFEVLQAESYKSAVNVLETEQEIQAVLCDLKMPGESGLEVLYYIKKKKINIPLIFLTGYGTLETCQDALREGAFDYILKPIDNKDKVVLPLSHAVEKYMLEKKNKEMQIDILRMAEEHQKILGDILTDVQTKEKVQKQISRIVDKWS